MHAYTEDTILADKLKRSGGRIFFQPAASVLHLQYAQGGCRISDASQQTAEWEKPYSKLYWLYLHPPTTRREWWRRYYQALRHGPLRRSSVRRFWAQPYAWYSFFKSAQKARRDAREELAKR